MENNQLILVFGATGHQGGAVAQHLMNDGWQVRAVTRDSNKPAAKELARRGAEVVQANMEDRLSIERAIEGCYGVFSVQQYWEVGFAAEIRQGKLVADVAREAGIQHLVYTSVGGAERDTGIPHFDSKWQIEQHIASLDLPSTILRPVFFFENFIAPPLRDEILSGMLSTAMQPDKTLQMIAVNDIGGIAALAFRRPGQFMSKAIEIAGDELTMPQVAEMFSAVLRRPVKNQQVPLEQMEKSSYDSAVMFRWFNEHGYQANIEALREIYPPLTTFEQWLYKVWVEAAASAA